MGRLSAALVALVIAGALGLVYPWFFGDAIGAAFTSDEAIELDQTAILLLEIFALQAVFIFLRHYLMSWVGERVVADLRLELQRHLVRMPQSYFHHNRTGELLSRMNDDVTQLQNVVGQDLSIFLRNVLTLIGSVVLLFLISPSLTGITLAVVPPLVIGATIFGRIIRRLAKEAQKELAMASGSLQEGLGAIETVQAFTRESFESQRYAVGIEKAFGLSVKQILARSWFMSGSSLVAFVSVAGIFWIGGRMVIDGVLDAEELAQFFLYTMSVAAAVGALSGLWGSYQKAIGATERVFEILDEQPEIADAANAQPLTNARGELRFEGVSFAYGDRETAVIADLDLDISPGETCALVGSSGSGKTTVGRLVLRFWDPTSGRITLDGHDLREVKLAELRGAMALVSQDPVLFSGTIRENIRYGRLDANDDEVEEAARAANADGFIREFPEGYETVVGERGVKLSGGQRQRVSIARALLRDPRVLLLDEATSALDSESEALVQAALDRLASGRTTLVIAHRLSTIRDADRIVVLDHGRIVEQGRHDELLALDGAYARLVARQAGSGTELGPPAGPEPHAQVG